MHALAGKPVRAVPFEYEFGAFQAESRGRPLIDIAELRAQLGRFENPIQRLSRTGLNYLDRVVEFDPMDATRTRVRLLLERSDLLTLDRYLQQRLALARENRRSLQERLSRFKTLPRESIRLHEPNWLRSRHSGGSPQEQNDRDD
jgi:hypothetical protein